MRRSAIGFVEREDYRIRVPMNILPERPGRSYKAANWANHGTCFAGKLSEAQLRSDSIYMSTLHVTLNLNGSAKAMEGAMAPKDGKLSEDADTDGESGPLQLFADTPELGASPFVTVVQALFANGNGLPETGQDLPLEASGPPDHWAGARAGMLAGAIEASLSAGTELHQKGDPVFANLDGKFELSPLAQVLERLQGPKEVFALRDGALAALTGQTAEDPSSTFRMGAGQFAALHRLADTPTGARPTFSLEVPLGQEKWADALGERLTLLLKGDQQVARLRLDPPHLGPLELRVALNHDQASVAFVAQHALVREALEQAIPRLRELLGQQDLQLVDVDVSQGELAGGRGEHESARGSTAPATGAPEHGDGPDVATERVVDTRQARRLVDLFV
jgi:flagellar hook-length control protein FliK